MDHPIGVISFIVGGFYDIHVSESFYERQKSGYAVKRVKKQLKKRSNDIAFYIRLRDRENKF